jgi:hypothetical protein
LLAELVGQLVDVAEAAPKHPRRSVLLVERLVIFAGVCDEAAWSIDAS